MGSSGTAWASDRVCDRWKKHMLPSIAVDRPSNVKEVYLG